MAGSYLTVGSFGIESVVTARGEVFRRRIGGNTVYAAAGVRVWSDDLGVIGSLPANFPQSWLEELARAGVDIRGAVRTGLKVELEEWFIYQADGSRLDQLYAEAGRRLPLNPGQTVLAPAEVDALLDGLTPHPSGDSVSLDGFRRRHPPQPGQIPEDVWPVRACHLAPLPFTLQLEFAGLIRSRGGRVTLDPGRYVQDMSPDQLEQLLAQVDAFLPSQAELEALFPGASPAEGLRALAGLGARCAVVKLGGEGCLVWSAEAEAIRHVPAFPARVVHLNGAGDAFCGGFLTGLAETGDPVAAAQRGAVSASFVVEARDALAVLGTRRAEAEARLAELRQGRAEA